MTIKIENPIALIIHYNQCNRFFFKRMARNKELFITLCKSDDCDIAQDFVDKYPDCFSYNAVIEVIINNNKKMYDFLVYNFPYYMKRFNLTELFLSSAL